MPADDASQSGKSLSHSHFRRRPRLRPLALRLHPKSAFLSSDIMAIAQFDWQEETECPQK